LGLWRSAGSSGRKWKIQNRRDTRTQDKVLKRGKQFGGHSMRTVTQRDASGRNQLATKIDMIGGVDSLQGVKKNSRDSWGGVATDNRAIKNR